MLQSVMQMEKPGSSVLNLGSKATPPVPYHPPPASNRLTVPQINVTHLSRMAINAHNCEYNFEAASDLDIKYCFLTIRE